MPKAMVMDTLSPMPMAYMPMPAIWHAYSTGSACILVFHDDISHRHRHIICSDSSHKL